MRSPASPGQRQPRRGPRLRPMRGAVRNPAPRPEARPGAVRPARVRSRRRRDGSMMVARLRHTARDRMRPLEDRRSGTAICTAETPCPPRDRSTVGISTIPHGRDRRTATPCSQEGRWFRRSTRTPVAGISRLGSSLRPRRPRQGKPLSQGAGAGDRVAERLAAQRGGAAAGFAKSEGSHALKSKRLATTLRRTMLR